MQRCVGLKRHPFRPCVGQGAKQPAIHACLCQRIAPVHEAHSTGLVRELQHSDNRSSRVQTETPYPHQNGIQSMKPQSCLDSMLRRVAVGMEMQKQGFHRPTLSLTEIMLGQWRFPFFRVGFKLYQIRPNPSGSHFASRGRGDFGQAPRGHLFCAALGNRIDCGFPTFIPVKVQQAPRINLWGLLSLPNRKQHFFVGSTRHAGSFFGGTIPKI